MGETSTTKTIGQLHREIGRLTTENTRLQWTIGQQQQRINEQRLENEENEDTKETIKELEEDLKAYNPFNDDEEEDDLEQGEPETEREREIIQKYEQRITRIIEQQREEIRDIIHKDQNREEELHIQMEKYETRIR